MDMVTVATDGTGKSAAVLEFLKASTHDHQKYSTGC